MLYKINVGDLVVSHPCMPNKSYILTVDGIQDFYFNLVNRDQNDPIAKAMAESARKSFNAGSEEEAAKIEPVLIPVEPLYESAHLFPNLKWNKGSGNGGVYQVTCDKVLTEHIVTEDKKTNTFFVHTKVVFSNPTKKSLVSEEKKAIRGRLKDPIIMTRKQKNGNSFVKSTAYIETGEYRTLEEAIKAVEDRDTIPKMIGNIMNEIL